MKKIFALGWMLVAALALTNCSKEEAVAPEMEGEAFEIVASANGSRTTMADLKTTWKSGDAMNVWTAKGDSYQSHGQFTISDVENGTFEGTLDASFDNTTANDWYVMYPYNAKVLLPDGSNYMYVGHTTPKQNGNNSQAHLSGSSAPLYGIAKNVAGSETPVFQMHHLSTFVRVRVTNKTEAPFSVASVYLTSENEFYLVGSYYVNITGEEVEYVPSGGTYTKTDVTLTVNNGEEIAVGEQAEFYLPLAPIQFGANDEMLTVNIKTTEGATISVEKTIPGGTKFAAGKLNTLNAVATVDNTEYPEVATPETWSLMTSAEDIISGGEYVILAQNAIGTWSYLPTTAIEKNPAAVAQNIFDGTTAVYENTVVPFAMRWTITKNDEGNFVFTTADGNYLSCGEKAQTIAIGATMDSWIAGAHSKNNQRIAFMSVKNSRYLGIYLDNPSWRGYVGDAESGYGTNGVGAQIILYYCGTYTAKSPLTTPANVTATVQNDTEVVVSWDAVDNAANYTVTCGTEVATVTGTTHTFTELTQGLSYNITVVAHPEAGSTKYSDSAAATTSVEIPNASNAILTENFDDVTTGESNTTNGSNTAWSGNASFPTVNTAYSAGGAVKIGKSKGTGSITSKSLDLSKPFSVTIAVKGWTSVEGKLNVTVGDQVQTITYTEKMADGFGAYTVDFDAATASSTITIATTAKRAFIDSVIVTAK